MWHRWCVDRCSTWLMCAVFGCQIKCCFFSRVWSVNQWLWLCLRGEVWSAHSWAKSSQWSAHGSTLSLSFWPRQKVKKHTQKMLIQVLLHWKDINNCPHQIATAACSQLSYCVPSEKKTLSRNTAAQSPGQCSSSTETKRLKQLCLTINQQKSLLESKAKKTKSCEDSRQDDHNHKDTVWLQIPTAAMPLLV